MTEAVSASERSRIQLCGRLSVELDGVELANALRGKQVPLLLAYLVMSRKRVVGREELIGALWPHNAPRSQDAALRTLLSRLRSALGPSVLIGREELMLELPEPAWVDVEAAVNEIGRAWQALHRGDARSAWALAQVPLNIASRGLLPGAQAPWIETRRRELADLRLQALEVIGRAGIGLGGSQVSSVERAARTLIEAEPYRESGYVLLMQALQIQGNDAEGLRVFDRLRTLLRDELGTAPSPDAIAIHQQLLQPSGGAHAVATPERLGAPAIPVPAELLARARQELVGRVEELRELEQWLLSAGDSGPGAIPGDQPVLLLSGDPGVGKTRLLAEIARRAHAHGSLVLAGRSPEQTLVPFQPFVEALGQYVSAAPLSDLRALTREHGAELSRLLPELRRRLPELPAAGPGDPETERYRLFEAVVGLLNELAASMPVLIILDDLQWADRPTLLLLRHLARATQATSLSVLGAYRSTEQSNEGFEPALAGLRRDRLMSEMEVRGLTEQDATDLVGLRIGGSPSADFSRALYEETEGNPFFIEEIVRHLMDSGVEAENAGARDLQRFGVPDDVKEVISRRMQRLSSDAFECLRVAAVIGRDFDASLVEDVLGYEEDRFLAVLDEALAAGLVAESPADPGRYAFSHALIRETLYEGMSATRRARVHRRVGVSLEAIGATQHAGALAHHFTRAAEQDDSEQAIRYALEAGEQATTMLAHEQAADHYARALEVLGRFDPGAQSRRCEVLLLLGEAQIRSGERPRAWTTFREAAALASELGDGASLTRAAIGASRRLIQPPGVVDEELIGLLERALEITPDEPSLLRVQLLTRLCGTLYYSDRRGYMRRLSAQATVLAAELGDPRAKAMAAAGRRRAYWGPGHLDRRLSDSTQLLRAAREARDIELTLQGHAWLVVDLLESGDRSAVDVQIEAFTAAAQELRQPLFLWNAAVWRAMRSLLAGDLEQADALAADALNAGIRPEGITAPQYYAVQQLAIRREQLRMSELEPALRELTNSNPHRPAWRAGLATLLCETDRLDEARRELDVLAAGDFVDIPPDGDWMITMTLLADVIAAVGDPDRAARVYELLLPYGRANVVIGLAAVCLGATARYLGRLAATMGENTEAIGLLERAIERNSALKAPIHLAHTQLDYARVLGPGPQARSLIEAARRTAQELDLPMVNRRVERLRGD